MMMFRPLQNDQKRPEHLGMTFIIVFEISEVVIPVLPGPLAMAWLSAVQKGSTILFPIRIGELAMPIQKILLIDSFVKVSVPFVQFALARKFAPLKIPNKLVTIRIIKLSSPLQLIIYRNLQKKTLLSQWPEYLSPFPHLNSPNPHLKSSTQSPI